MAETLLCTHAIVQPRIMPENAHIHHHKAQQLGLPGAIIFTVNFFGESMGVFEPSGWRQET